MLSMNEWSTAIKESMAKPPLPFWIAFTPQTDYPALEQDISVDVAVIGGGIAGITAAMLLKREGLTVAAIEADRIIQGTSGHTTAKITSQHTLIYHKLKTKLGVELARQYAEANESAIHFIAKLIEEKSIACDFSWQPAYVYTQQEAYVQQIQDEVNTASDLGIDAVYLEEIPLPFKVKAAMQYSGQAQFHPRKYLLALAEEIPGGGSHIFEQTRAVDLKEGQSCTVVTENGKKVTAKQVVIATHYPFYDGKGMYFARIYPSRSYAVGVKIKEKFPGGMYITAENPARSLRFQPFEGGEMVIAAGEHHKTGNGENLSSHYENLMQFVSGTYTLEDVMYRWSTQDYSTMDGAPYAGHLTSKTSNIYVATGFDKWGMTNSTASAMIIRDLIVSGKNPWVDVYNPSRVDVSASAAKFVKENADVAVSLISGKLEMPPGNADLEKGEAKLVASNSQRLGAYRDEKGMLHVVDTTCTHMGCELRWNDAERTWDCPCHGSRFTYEGEIVEGPAINPLSHNGGETNKIDPNIF